jgi:hypothetical protein
MGLAMPQGVAGPNWESETDGCWEMGLAPCPVHDKQSTQNWYGPGESDCLIKT